MRTSRPANLVGFFAAAALPACFHTTGILPFAGPGTSEAIAYLEAGDVRFATEVEVQNVNEGSARFDVDLIQGDEVVSHAVCDPLHIPGSRSCSYRIFDDFSCHYVMDCTAHLEQSGPTVVRAQLSILAMAPDFNLVKANLVIGR